MLKIGCCGFCVNQKIYFAHFDVIEIQQSFYRSLGERQVRNWRQKAPKGFEFILKVPQCITHFPNSPTYRRSDLSLEERALCGGFKLNRVTERIMEELFAKANLLNVTKFVFQTPPSFKPTSENLKNMARFFRFYKTRGIYIWEPRGREWTPQIVKEVCQELSLIHASDPFLNGPCVWGDFSYFRLHGNLKTYHYSYSDEELRKIFAMVRSKAYVMFNNSDMFANALKMKEMAISLQ